MCKVSIIIPAYNIENYIERCILSCVNQSFKNIEIIVVNDGSTDRTLETIKKIKDNRIVIIDKKNKGSMEARKSGWKVAKGEYILFVDGDDYIREDAVEVLYRKAKQENKDVVCYNFLTHNIDGTISKSCENSIDKSNNKHFIDRIFQNEINHSMCSKLIRKKFVIYNKIEFPSDFSFGEDLAFSYTLAMYNPSYTVIDDYLYYYCRREGSLDNEINEKTTEITQALTFVKEQLIKNNLFNKYREEFEYMAYMQSYYIRKTYIFNNTDNISRALFNNWRKLRININCKNNRLYSKLYENDSKKSLIVDAICKKYYLLGKLYYKIIR